MTGTHLPRHIPWHTIAAKPNFEKTTLNYNHWIFHNSAKVPKWINVFILFEKCILINLMTENSILLFQKFPTILHYLPLPSNPLQLHHWMCYSLLMTTTVCQWTWSSLESWHLGNVPWNKKSVHQGLNCENKFYKWCFYNCQKFNMCSLLLVLGHETNKEVVQVIQTNNMVISGLPISNVIVILIWTIIIHMTC